ncbi:MAG: hypothetical protein II073_02955 [Lachnospiraceae bacterium]|nr:hypothetical protein [Lachnospiraceae bacterium]
MEQLEKVEKLRERANVSYEDAKNALEASEWDLLEAMVYLEKQGKVEAPKESSHTTSYEQQNQYGSVREAVKLQKEQNCEGVGKKIKRLWQKFWRWSNDNNLVITRHEKKIVDIPMFVFLLVLVFALWNVALPIFIISLFFDCRYSITGKNDMHTINAAMEQAGKFTEKVKEEYNKL